LRVSNIILLEKIFMPSVLEHLQTAVVRELREHLCLAGAVVVARRAADLDSQIEAAVQAALGLSVIVLDPRPRRVASDAPGPVFVDIALTVRVIENLLVNETGAGLLAAAERASQVLHLWPLPAPCGDGVLRLAETDPWTAPAGPARGAVVLDLHFLAAGTIAAADTR
jgi:hypothetical protein